VCELVKSTKSQAIVGAGLVRVSVAAFILKVLSHGSEPDAIGFDKKSTDARTELAACVPQLVSVGRLARDRVHLRTAVYQSKL
jgi:hypothetical protein